MKKVALGLILFTAFNTGFCQSAIQQRELFRYDAAEIARLRNLLLVAVDDSSRLVIVKNIARRYSYVLDSAIYYNLKALNLSRTINDHIGELGALVELEVVLRHHGILLKGFNIARKGLKAAIGYNNDLFRAHFLGELGILYRESGLYVDAMKYLKSSRTLYDSIGEEYLAAYQTNSIGEVYLVRHELDSALDHCRMALIKSKEPANPHYWITFYSSLNLGTIFLIKNNFDSALYYLRGARNSAGFLSHHFFTNLSIARVYDKLQVGDSSIYYATEANRLASEGRVHLFSAEANDFLGKLYREVDVAKSINYTQKSLAFKDSLYRQSIVTALENFDELDEQEREFELQSAQAANQFQTRITRLLTGVSVLFVVMAILVRNYRQKLKSDLRLTQVQQEKEHFELEKAKEVDKLKSTFFANISHEFRTPLTLIKGPVQELMEEFGTHPRVTERLELVQQNADLVLNLINQLLDLAKLESGTLTVDRSKQDLNTFVGVTTRSFYSLAFQKNIALKTELPKDPLTASFDRNKVESILINLINNAIKFTRAGGEVIVRASLEKDKLHLEVMDTGIGIPIDQQEKVFERFHQVSDAHKEIGTGIGLALVKELTTLMGGSISLESQLGKGSSFKVVIPVDEVTPSVESRQTALSGQTAALILETPAEFVMQADTNGLDVEQVNKPKLLVVEDNNDLRKFIIDSLGREFHFLEAPDGKQGLEKALDETPDLIVSDVMMPEMDGITMTGKLKKDTRTSHIPIILLTAKTTEESKISGLNTGANDYLTKPFNKNELLLKIRNSIASQVKLREKIRLELLRESPKVEVQSADEKFLLKVREIILSRLADGQLGVESLAEQIGLSRSQLLRKITALTGSSVNELIRTFRLQKAAQLLEQNWGPVTQVAYEVGFSNLSYFSKIFKEQFGVLPSDYQGGNGTQ